MLPDIQIFGRSFPMYGMMALIGAMVASAAAVKAGEHRGINNSDMMEVLVAAALGVILGGHLLFALVSLPLYKELGFFGLFGGAVFYGGLYGGLAAGGLWARRKRLNMPLVKDMAAWVAPLFHGFARIGCFFAGCCYGVESECGFTMTRSLMDGANGVSRFPVQLVEAGLNFALWAALFFGFFRRGKMAGHQLPVYLSSYAVVRFIDEFFRGDIYRGLWGPFSTSQWIALATLIGCAIYFVLLHRKESLRKETPDESI